MSIEDFFDFDNYHEWVSWNEFKGMTLLLRAINQQKNLILN